MPFLSFTGRPGKEQSFYRSTDRQFLWDNDHPTTGGLRDAFCKVFGHGLAVMRDQDSPGMCSQRLYLRIT